jgi:hypothetical protein
VNLSTCKLEECIVAQAHANRRPLLGNFLGQPIYETITAHDCTYVFDRIASNIDGEFPLEQLGKDELLIRPGLIYRPAK